ncbi:hypothetical protein CICLE_v10033426mg, partial [Citrus x clementina]
QSAIIICHLQVHDKHGQVWLFTELGWWVWIRVPELGFRFRTCLYAAANIRKRKEREKGTPLDVAGFISNKSEFLCT